MTPFSELTTSHLLRRSIAFDCNCDENSQVKISITHPGHRGAYNKGAQAKRNGLPRIPPYKGRYLSQPTMERLWLGGYDNEARKAK